MKVKEGNNPLPENWSTIATCKCKAILDDIRGPDLKRFQWFGTHFEHEYSGVYCPCCGEIVSVDCPDLVYEEFVAKKKKIFDGTDQSTC